MEPRGGTAGADGPTVASVVDGFGDLATLAPVAVEIVRIAEDENASMADLVAAIDNDPALAARLLRMANSSFYAQNSEVTSLLRAATLLGITTVKMLALGFTLASNVAVAGLDSSLLWRRSLTTSIVGRFLAEARAPRVCDDAYVAGLLGDIGKFALGSVPSFVERFAQRGVVLRAAEERDLLGFTSDEVSARILERWGLPSVLIEAIRWRSEPTAGPEDLQDLAAVLNVAEAAAAFLLSHGDEQASALGDLRLRAASFLGLTENEVEALLAASSEDLNDIAILFELEAIAPTPIVELTMSAQSAMARISLDMAAAMVDERGRNEALTEQNEKLNIEVTTDPLTDLPNRRMYDSFVDYQVQSHHRRPRATKLALILIDIDHFKTVNDTYGHAVGDEVLTAIGQRLAATTRRTELAARIGGEEFAIVLPDAAEADLAGALERMRRLIGDEPVETSVGPLTVTASLGAAFFSPGDGPDPAGLFESADRALYASKHGGRNRATVASSKR